MQGTGKAEAPTRAEGSRGLQKIQVAILDDMLDDGGKRSIKRSPQVSDVGGRGWGGG